MCKVNGKGRILTPNDTKIPGNFSNWIWHPWLRPQDLHQCKFSFQFVQRGFSTAKWNITVLWLFLVSYLVIFVFCIFVFFFLGHAPRSNPWMDFHGLWLVRRVVAQGRSFWRLWQYRNSFEGNIPKNSPKGAWIGNFKPNGPNIKIAISCEV